MSTQYHFVLKKLVNLHNETAMLEICDWDEERLQKLYGNLEIALLEVNTPILDNLKRFCSQQLYVSKRNREVLYELLEEAMINEMKNITKKEKEYEN